MATASVATSTTTAAETDEDEGITSSNITKPKLDGIRLTATGKAKDDANKKRLQRHLSAATKRATTLYYEEQKKGKDGMTATQISTMVKKAYGGVGPSARSITRYVNEYSLVACSPLKCGSLGSLPT
jgi:hypothetical protein